MKKSIISLLVIIFTSTIVSINTNAQKNGTYTEQIEFFSRDNSRVGAKLNFQYEIIENEWHHSGMSSKGAPIYEIWSPRIMPQKK